MEKPQGSESKEKKGFARGLWSSASYRASEILLAVLLVISVGVNYYLSREVNRLRDGINAMQSRGQLAEGTDVPRFEAMNLMNGDSVTVDYAEAAVPTVLYVMSPNCGWCDRNTDNVRQLAANLDGKYRIYGITLTLQNFEKLKDEEHRLDFPILGELSPEVIKTYQFGGTPQTLVVSTEGKVLKNWMGAYTQGLDEQIESYFSVKLPGLREMPAADSHAAAGSR